MTSEGTGCHHCHLHLVQSGKWISDLGKLSSAEWRMGEGVNEGVQGAIDPCWMGCGGRVVVILTAVWFGDHKRRPFPFCYFMPFLK